MKLFIKANSIYSSLRGPQTDKELDDVAKAVARRVASYAEVTTEDVIEAFRSMNPDYDDYYVRGLKSKKVQKYFVNKLISKLKKYGIDNVVNITF